MHPISELPVLILAYNRFEKFKRCINTLEEQGIKNIFISVDGPRNKYDMDIQKKIFQFCKNDKLDLKLEINFLHQNKGCRIAPLKGISWFLKRNQYGIILEDDVILSKKCIETFSTLLQDYFHRKDYISLSSFNEFTEKKIESIYALPVWRSWGWATWSHKWEKYIEFKKEIEKYSLWEIYNLLPLEFRSIETAKIIKSCQLNLLDAWDYEFNLYHLLKESYSLTLGGINNYVYGFDETATHTTSVDNCGIDFSLFKEREIDFNNINILSNENIFLTLNKCGFNIIKNKNYFGYVYDYLKNIYYSFIFLLRILKRIIYKRL
tara:strand:- start:4326 stop:5288 length:963 start_codon:yes stop_codon:yes gene_type:complete